MLGLFPEHKITVPTCVSFTNTLKAQKCNIVLIKDGTVCYCSPVQSLSKVPLRSSFKIVPSKLFITSVLFLVKKKCVFFFLKSNCSLLDFSSELLGRPLALNNPAPFPLSITESSLFMCSSAIFIKHSFFIYCKVTSI